MQKDIINLDALSPLFTVTILKVRNNDLKTQNGTKKYSKKVNEQNSTFFTTK